MTSLAAAPAQQPAQAPDPRRLKEYESVLQQRFTRDPGDLLRQIERATPRDPASMPANERFQLFFATGDWAKLRDELRQMPPDLAVSIYDKILVDLTAGRKPAMRLDDVIGLSDAAPGGFTSDNVRRLGQLLGIAVPLNESFWLADRLQRGTARFGGSDPAKRLLAARLLIAGNFRDLARSYLPSNDQIAQIEDEGVREELMAFAATQEQRESARRSEVQRIWDDNIRDLLEPPAAPRGRALDRNKAIAAISRIVTQVPQSTLAPAFSELVKSNPEAALKLLAAIARKAQGERNGEVATRTQNLAVQAQVANLLCNLTSPEEQPWVPVLELMAQVWLSEAENTFAQKAAASNQQRFVLPEDLMLHAPAGNWAAALSAGTRDRIDVGTARLILSAAHFDLATERIIAIGKRSPRAGAALAEDFLVVWARNHNPQIPEPIRRKFSLPEDARIPVTPVMMEKNIASLARMMALFRESGIAPADSTKVVEAFDLAYSSAETYRTSHIEKVFGPMDRMDEPLFFLILSRMGENLGERWRKMEVQQAGMTQRDEKQTLDLVREGYGNAMKLIDSWLATHGDGWRALTLAGSLLVEWGDFEYFQELVTGDRQLRLAGYQEKNLLAQEYFDRGAAAYGAQVARLASADYSVDAYLGWFHGLLGIGANGQLNLSKPLNRAALTRIREHLLALPGKASQAHISRFAKIVNDRLSDEKDPLHEELKYRYLASSLLITKDDPFTLGVQKKVAYLDELLSEVRLQTRPDGPNTVGRDQDFGVIVSIVHTEAMGRAARFGQYLTNDPIAGFTGKKPAAMAKKMRVARGPRDELELNITESLAPFFEIRSVTFATPDVLPRPTSQEGWDETVLAYVHVRVKDASVDRIPPVQLDLKFVDLSGPITIPAESAETLIQVVTGDAAPRPASRLEIDQVLDTRQLNLNGSLTLEVKASAMGLVPELGQLLDLKFPTNVAVRNVNPGEGLQVVELNTWGDEVAPRSERRWILALDGDQVRASEAPVRFDFPPPIAKDAAVTYSTYSDMNLTPLQRPFVLVGRAVTTQGDVLATPATSHSLLPGILGTAVLALATAFWFLRRAKAVNEAPPRACDLFPLPSEIDGFAVAVLLRRLGSSPRVKLEPAQQSELQADLKRVERACFGAQTPAVTESDLRAVAAKWLQNVTLIPSPVSRCRLPGPKR